MSYRTMCSITYFCERKDSNIYKCMLSCAWTISGRNKSGRSVCRRKVDFFMMFNFILYPSEYFKHFYIII